MIAEKMPGLIRPGWKLDDHDCQISVYVRTTEQLMAIILDPDFQALVAGDAEIG